MPSGGEHEPRREQPDGARHAAESPIPTEDYLVMLNRGMDRHGEAFLAYLILDGVEQRSLDLINDFEDAFVGYWPDRESFVLHATEILGWDARVHDFERTNGTWTGALEWDRNPVWDQFQGLYRITQRLGGVYVFTR